MRRFQVAIQRSELLTIPDSVGEWEIPILQLVHTPERVAIGDSTRDAANYPSAAVEFDRLERRYGEDPATGITRVASVYGPAPGGIRALLVAIRDAATETNQPETLNGGIEALSDELNEEIAPPTDEVDVVGPKGTPDASKVPPVTAKSVGNKTPVKKPPAKQAGKQAGKQVLPKSAAPKAAPKKAPVAKNDPVADPLAIDE